MGMASEPERTEEKETQPSTLVVPPGFDEPNTIESDESTGSGPQNKNTKGSPDTDEYELSKSDTDDSENSLIKEMRVLPKQRANKKPTMHKSSAKARGKQVAKAQAAPVTTKKNNRPARSQPQKRVVASNQVTRSQKEKRPPSDEVACPPQNSEAHTKCGNRSASDAEPHSQAQHTTVSISKPKSLKIRQPKPPFFPDKHGEKQENAGLDSSAHINPTMGQNLKSRKGKSSPSPLEMADRVQDRPGPAATQNKRTAPIQPGLCSKRQKLNDDDTLTVEKRDIISTDNHPSSDNFNPVVASPIMISSDKDTPFSSADMDYGEMHQQHASSPQKDIEATSIYGNFELGQCDVNRTSEKVAVHREVDLPPLSDCYESEPETNIKATTTENSEVYSLPRTFQDLGKANEETKGNRKVPAKSHHIRLAETREPLATTSLDTTSKTVQGVFPSSTFRSSTCLSRDSIPGQLNRSDFKVRETTGAGQSVSAKHQYAAFNGRKGMYNELPSPETSWHQNLLAQSQRVAQNIADPVTEKQNVTPVDLLRAETRPHANYDLGFDNSPSVKVSKNILDTDETLHPKSIAFARRLAQMSRLAQTVAEPPKAKDEAECQVQTPEMARTPPEDPVDEWKSTLEGPRGAVFQSIQMVTMVSSSIRYITLCVGVNRKQAIFRHLQSKETTMDEIVNTYERNGRKLIHNILNDQASELYKAGAAFDKRCIRLGRLFRESAGHAKTLRNDLSKADNYYRAKGIQMRAELDEAIMMAREAAASL